MPFTFSHPAIVLPLRKFAWVSFPALVLGSMAPDFEYFLRLAPYSVYSHTTLGLFTFDLPLVMLLYLLYRFGVEKGLLAVVPLWVAKGLAGDKGWDQADRGRGRGFFLSFVIFAYSALLGSFSHVLWDSFTHDRGSMVERFALLQQRISLAAWEVPVYKLLQHGSTLLGGLAIVYVIWRCGRERRERSIQVEQAAAHVKGLFWIGVAAVGMAVACWDALFVKGVSPVLHPLQHVVPFISGALLGVCLFAPVVSRFGLKNKA
ncbi:DUF4184 family protein [Brevibacillus parabrevis]|uniref:DUF4184 family protein n=1 Tax=Brevibacillus parabrevis TaxID=54914 RepID=UPI002E1B949D|nr:DUF4184 family protein [Brevibacillus parabrevis]